jgi:hypothetical protein
MPKSTRRSQAKLRKKGKAIQLQFVNDLGTRLGQLFSTMPRNSPPPNEETYATIPLETIEVTEADLQVRLRGVGSNWSGSGAPRRHFGILRDLSAAFEVERIEVRP